MANPPYLRRNSGNLYDEPNPNGIAGNDAITLQRQRSLQNAGYYKGPLDAQWGPKSQTAEYKYNQQKMKDAGFYTDPKDIVDGSWGPRSQAAWKEYNDYQQVLANRNKPMTLQRAETVPMENAPAVAPPVTGEFTGPQEVSVRPPSWLTGEMPTLAPGVPLGAGAPAQTRTEQALAGLKRVGEGATGAIGAAGNYIKENPLAAINTGLGVAGLAMYAGAKRPEQLKRPEMYASEIPVQQYEDDRARAYAANAATLSTAQQGLQRQAGSDINSYLAGMQNLQAQQLGARAGIDQKIMDLRRSDAQEAAAKRNEDGRYNMETQRSYDEAIYNEAVGRFNQARAKGEKLSQGALDYWSAKDQENRQYAQNVLKQQGEQNKAAYDSELRIISGKYTGNTDADREGYEKDIKALNTRYGVGPTAPVLQRTKKS